MRWPLVRDGGCAISPDRSGRRRCLSSFWARGDASVKAAAGVERGFLGKPSARVHADERVRPGLNPCPNARRTGVTRFRVPDRARWVRNLPLRFCVLRERGTNALMDAPVGDVFRDGVGQREAKRRARNVAKNQRLGPLRRDPWELLSRRLACTWINSTAHGSLITSRVFRTANPERLTVELARAGTSSGPSPSSR